MDIDGELLSDLKALNYDGDLSHGEDDHMGETQEEEYEISDLVKLCSEIDDEITNVHKSIRENYAARFPELEFLVPNPMDYARLVRKLGNATDISAVDLDGLFLPPAVVMSVSIAASTTTGNQLSQHTFQKTVESCDRALGLDSARQKMVDLLASRCTLMAPNLCALVGTKVAAKLLMACSGGGLGSLAMMPACNVLVLGSEKQNLVGFSSAASKSHVGFLRETDIIQVTPAAWRSIACRVLADKCILAIRVDYLRGDPTGKYGRSLRDQICEKMKKLQEPPPARIAQPLPLPDLKPRKKRGGRRYRKSKSRYSVTELRKLSNRVQFGVPEHSSLGDGFGEGYGMLGKLPAVAATRPKLAPKKAANKCKVKCYSANNAFSGFTSSFTFTPLQGIQLCNPEPHCIGSGTRSTYFSETGTFGI